MKRYANKISIWLIKYIPIICNFMLLEMCIESYFDICLLSNSGYFISGYSYLFILLLLSLSIAKHFCFWHLMLIINMAFSLTMSLFFELNFKIPYILYIVSITTSFSLLLTLFILTWKKITKTLAKIWSLTQKLK